METNNVIVNTLVPVLTFPHGLLNCQQLSIITREMLKETSLCHYSCGTEILACNDIEQVFSNRLIVDRSVARIRFALIYFFLMIARRASVHTPMKRSAW